MIPHRRVLSSFAAFTCASLVLVSQANAGTVNRTVNFDPGSPGTFFSADISATGALVLSATANIEIGVGTVVDASVSIPVQTFQINESATVTSNPTGNITLQLPDTAETFGGAYPDLAGALTEADIPQLDVSLVDNTGISILNLSETITGSASIDILGITDIDAPLQANLDVNGVLKNVIYSQVGGALLGPGVVTNPNGPAPGSPPGSVTTEYASGVGGVISAGTASLDAEASVSGDINLDLGIFGSVGGDLPDTTVVDDTVPIDVFALLFNMVLTDLEPGLFDGPRDVNLDIDGNFDILGALEFDFDDEGSVPLPSTTIDIPVDFGLFSVDIPLTITGALDFSLDTDIELQNLTYGLEDEVVADLLVPEPSSIMLVVMGLVALMPVVAVKRRKTKV